MDKISKILKNLEYQKLNFNNIYNCYLENLRLEVATTEIFDTYVNKHEKITILCEDYQRILEEIFYVNLDSNDISEDINTYSSILIDKSYTRDGEFFERENTLCISLGHQYTLNGMKIELITKLKKSTLESTSALIITKKINLFDKKIIEFKEIRVIEALDNDRIKIELTGYKAKYCEKKFIEKRLRINREKFNPLKLDLDDNFKVSLSLEYIKKLTDANESEYLEIASKMERHYRRAFLQNANDMLIEILDDNFKNNYYKVDILLNEYEEFLKDLIKEEKNFIKDLKKISGNSSDSEKYLAIGNSEIGNFDKITSQSLDNFSSKIFELMIERG